jgi:hypothetical protein
MSIIGFPSYLVGRHFSSVVVTGGGFVSGAFVAGTTPAGGNLATTGVFDGFSLRRIRESARIRPINAAVDNNVALAAGFEATVQAIRFGDGSCLLDTLASAYSYLECVVNVTDEGGATPATTQAIVGLITDASNEDVEDKNIFTVTLIPCGVVTYSGVYTTTPLG